MTHRTKAEAAAAYLRAVLAGGPVAARSVAAGARAAGHAERTIRRARQALGVTTTQPRGADGRAGEALWALPDQSSPATTPGLGQPAETRAAPGQPTTTPLAQQPPDAGQAGSGAVPAVAGDLAPAGAPTSNRGQAVAADPPAGNDNGVAVDGRLIAARGNAVAVNRTPAPIPAQRGARGPARPAEHRVDPRDARRWVEVTRREAAARRASAHLHAAINVAGLASAAGTVALIAYALIAGL